MAAISSKHPVAGADVFDYLWAMEKPPVIDHDPNEKPRQTKGEMIFVTAGTTVVLISLALFLKWIANNYDLKVLATVCATIVFTLLGIAVRSEWKKARRLW